MLPGGRCGCSEETATAFSNPLESVEADQENSQRYDVRCRWVDQPSTSDQACGQSSVNMHLWRQPGACGLIAPALVCQCTSPKLCQHTLATSQPHCQTASQPHTCNLLRCLQPARQTDRHIKIQSDKATPPNYAIPYVPEKQKYYLGSWMVSPPGSMY